MYFSKGYIYIFRGKPGEVLQNILTWSMKGVIAPLKCFLPFPPFITFAPLNHEFKDVCVCVCVCVCEKWCNRTDLSTEVWNTCVKMQSKGSQAHIYTLRVGGKKSLLRVKVNIMKKYYKIRRGRGIHIYYICIILTIQYININAVEFFFNSK